MELCECGFTKFSGNHSPYCDQNADPEKVSESMKRDPERWIESYVDRSTQAVRRMVLAAGNGHSQKVNGTHFDIPRPRRPVRDNPQA